MPSCPLRPVQALGQAPVPVAPACSQAKHLHLRTARCHQRPRRPQESHPSICSKVSQTHSQKSLTPSCASLQHERIFPCDGHYVDAAGKSKQAHVESRKSCSVHGRSMKDHATLRKCRTARVVGEIYGHQWWGRSMDTRPSQLADTSSHIP